MDQIGRNMSFSALEFTPQDKYGQLKLAYRIVLPQFVMR